MLVKKTEPQCDVLKICLFFAIYEPRDAYKGDAYRKKTCKGFLYKKLSKDL